MRRTFSQHLITGSVIENLIQRYSRTLMEAVSAEQCLVCKNTNHKTTLRKYYKARWQFQHLWFYKGDRNTNKGTRSAEHTINTCSTVCIYT